MTSDLGERLDELALRKTGGLRLEHPSTPMAREVSTSPQRRPAGLFAAAVALIAIITGSWWLSGSVTSTVDIASQPFSQPIPSLFLEDPLPITDLPERIQDTFADPVRIRPLQELRPNAAPLTFDGVHVVNSDGIVVAVGIDTTGTHQCFAVYEAASDTGSASCGPSTGLRPRVASSAMSSPSSDLTVFLVPNDVVAVETGSAVAEVERNVAVLNRREGDETWLVLNDGTREAAKTFPDPSAVGHFDTDQEELFAVIADCLIVDDDFIFQASFAGSGFVTVVVTPDGLFATGTVNDEPFDGVVDNAVVETNISDGFVTVSASWAGDQTGSLEFDCGDNLLDLTDIR